MYCWVVPLHNCSVFSARSCNVPFSAALASFSRSVNAAQISFDLSSVKSLDANWMLRELTGSGNIYIVCDRFHCKQSVQHKIHCRCKRALCWLWKSFDAVNSTLPPTRSASPPRTHWSMLDLIETSGALACFGIVSSLLELPLRRSSLLCHRTTLFHSTRDE